MVKFGYMFETTSEFANSGCTTNLCDDILETLESTLKMGATHSSWPALVGTINPHYVRATKRMCLSTHCRYFEYALVISESGGQSASTVTPRCASGLHHIDKLEEGLLGLLSLLQ